MDEESFSGFEDAVLDALEGKLVGLDSGQSIDVLMEKVARSIYPAVSKEEIARVISNAKRLDPIAEYLYNEMVEDIMINNTENIFVYQSDVGPVKVQERIKSKRELDKFVKKLKMYATSSTANRNIFDVHLPNHSRANIVKSPIGADITIRNYRTHAFSIIDLINEGELSYNMAGRLWLYSEGLGVRPANMLVGGLPAAGKTTLLNAMFSFFRPEERVVVIEDTYELNTETQENCVRLETSPEVGTRYLVQNALRMRPDRLIIGEVRADEAKDMMTAMNIGKISMSTLHASTARDVVTRLQHTPMNVEKDIIPLIDAIVITSQIREDGKFVRRISEVSEISGVETQVLLSDLYKYDYKEHKSSDILPSVTYRDTLARISGIPPSEIIQEEQRRGRLLERLNKSGVRELHQINELCRDYYENPEAVLQKMNVK